jgi:4-amino-4-deoxy-L-arabinose transferase-like glycosyltransferase
MTGTSNLEEASVDPLPTPNAALSTPTPCLAALPTRVALIALCAAWILLGLVGHDPWKPDEAYTFGIVFDLLKHGDWVVPTLAGEPFLEKPPLYFITAAFFARIFGHWLPLHDAARLASGFYVVVALAFLALTARELNRGRHGWTSVLIVIGCVGLVARSHQLITDLALWAGIAMAIYGLARGRRSTVAGGIAIGVGTAIAFLSKGLLGPGLIGVSALLLLLFPAWRQKTYARALVLAAIVALPAIAVWTIALYLRSADMFRTWLVTNNFGRFFGFVNIGPRAEPFFLPKTLIWYAFPALPLAAWTLWDAIRGRPAAWAEPALQLPAVTTVAMLGVLGVANDGRELYLMPTLLPLTLLAVAGIDRLPKGAADALSRAGFWVGVGAACALWLCWIALMLGEPAALARRLSDYQPGFDPKFSLLPFAVAVGVTLLWISIARHASADPGRGVVQWAAGVTVCWSLIGTLWLPFIDAGKSYRAMIESLALSLPEDGCVRSRTLGESQRAMLDYVAHIVTVRDEVATNASCRALLVQQGWQTTGALAAEPGWVPVWEGARPGDRSEYYRLYVREPAAHGPVRRFPR